MCRPDDVINLALGEIGYREKKTNANLDQKTAANDGSGNYTKFGKIVDSYPDFYNGKKQGYAWCDVFFDALFLLTYGYEKTLYLLCQPIKSLGAGCTYSATYYKNAGRFDGIARKGSQIFFTKNKTTSNHTGLVVDVIGNYVLVVEGNKNDRVELNCYDAKDSSIFGYGHPRYDEEESEILTLNCKRSVSKIEITIKE